LEDHLFLRTSLIKYRPMSPYQNLYHCMGHTYGTWLPGDPRGFRTRHHRDHCEGDYKNPPVPGLHADLYNRSKTLMKRAPVYLTPTQRQLAVDAIIASLLKRNIPAVIASVDRVHWHILAPFPDRNPRHWLGIAKKESSHFLKIQGQGIDGGLWAVRCQCIPIENAIHAARTRNYIADHIQQGASVWTGGPNGGAPKGALTHSPHARAF
jgi:hypothetical protein